MSSGLRILAVIVNLVPYHVARWSAVAEAGHQVAVLQRRAGDPFAVLATGADQAPFELHTLADPGAGGPPWPEQLLAWIDRLNPQVLVLSGYSFPESLAGLLVAAQRGLPVVVCSESNRHDAPRKPWTEALKRRVLKLAQAGLVGGEPQAAYLQQLGVAPEAIFRGYNAVDNDHFATAHHWRGLPALSNGTETASAHDYDDFAWVPKRQLNEYFSKDYFEIFGKATSTR